MIILTQVCSDWWYIYPVITGLLSLFLCYEYTKDEKISATNRVIVYILTPVIVITSFILAPIWVTLFFVRKK